MDRLPVRKIVVKEPTIVSLTPEELNKVKLGLGISRPFTRVGARGVITKGQKYIPNPEPEPVEKFPTVRKLVNAVKEVIRNTGKDRNYDNVEEMTTKILREEIDKVGKAEGFDEEEIDKMNEVIQDEIDKYYEELYGGN
jgi:hypothetical protein